MVFTRKSHFWHKFVSLLTGALVFCLAGNAVCVDTDKISQREQSNCDTRPHVVFSFVLLSGAFLAYLSWQLDKQCQDTRHTVLF